MEDVCHIIHRIYPQLPVREFREEWRRITEEVVLPIYSQSLDVKEFVVLVHEYFRVKRGLGYKLGVWDFFTALLEPSVGCNCFCSSILVLLAAHEVGLFPLGNDERGLWGRKVGGHFFVGTGGGGGEEIFETTADCRNDWESRGSYCQVQLEQDPGNCCYYRIGTLDQLPASVARNVIGSTLKPPRGDLRAKVRLAETYSDPENPEWVYLMIHLEWLRLVRRVETGEREPYHIPLGHYDDFLRTIFSCPQGFPGTLASALFTLRNIYENKGVYTIDSGKAYETAQVLMEIIAATPSPKINTEDVSLTYWALTDMIARSV